MSDLRSHVIRVAAALPQGDETRRKLLAAVKDAGGTTWFAYLQECQQAFIDDILGQATAILRQGGAKVTKEGKNYLEFTFRGSKGSVLFNFGPGDGMKVQLTFGALLEEDIVGVMLLDPKGVALRALYLEHRGQPILPL